MEEKIRAAFAPDVSLREFFFEHLKGVHESRLEDWARVSRAPLILSFLFEDTGERYTVEFSPTGYKVEAGDMVDFPAATIATKASDWEALREDLRDLALALYASEQRLEKKYVKGKLNAETLSDFEALSGTIEVHITGAKAPVTLKAYLNDYEPSDGPDRFAITLDRDVLMKMARGEIDPRGLSAGQLKVSGKMGFALDLAGFFQKRMSS